MQSTNLKKAYLISANTNRQKYQEREENVSSTFQFKLHIKSAYFFFCILPRTTKKQFWLKRFIMLFGNFTGVVIYRRMYWQINLIGIRALEKYFRKVVIRFPRSPQSQQFIWSSFICCLPNNWSAGTQLNNTDTVICLAMVSLMYNRFRICYSSRSHKSLDLRWSMRIS